MVGGPCIHMCKAVQTLQSVLYFLLTFFISYYYFTLRPGFTLFIISKVLIINWLEYVVLIEILMFNLKDQIF